MNVTIRPWQLSDAADVAAIVNNKKVQDNLRDGIPFPYTEKDGADFIGSMLNAEPPRWGITSARNTGAKAYVPRRSTNLPICV